MTVAQAINDFDERLIDNGFPAERKYRWVSELDLRIKAEIIDTHYPNDSERHAGGHRCCDICFRHCRRHSVPELDIEFEHGEHCPFDPAQEDDFIGYDPSEPDAVLIVPAAFGEIYEAWLCYRAYDANGEVERAINAGNRFNEIYEEFARWYHRTHRAKGSTAIRI